MIHRTRPRLLKSVAVSLTVDAVVVEGRVSQEDLLAWLQESVDRYHEFRAGFVGIEAHARMKKPKLTLAGRLTYRHNGDIA